MARSVDLAYLYKYIGPWQEAYVDLGYMYKYIGSWWRAYVDLGNMVLYVGPWGGAHVDLGYIHLSIHVYNYVGPLREAHAQFEVWSQEPSGTSRVL